MENMRKNEHKNETDINNLTFAKERVEWISDDLEVARVYFDNRFSATVVEEQGKGYAVFEVFPLWSLNPPPRRHRTPEQVTEILKEVSQRPKFSNVDKLAASASTGASKLLSGYPVKPLNREYCKEVVKKYRTFYPEIAETWKNKES